MSVLVVILVFLLLFLKGRPSILLQAGLRSGLVHQGVHDDSDFLVCSLGPHHQLEGGTLPIALRRYSRGNLGCLNGTVCLGLCTGVNMDTELRRCGCRWTNELQLFFVLGFIPTSDSF